MGDKNYYLTDDEAKLLFSDVTVIRDMKELEGLTIVKVIDNRIETEVDDDSAYATQILVIHAIKNKKKSTYVLCTDISAYGGYEICPQSEIKVRTINDVPTIYWDVESRKSESGDMYYPRSLGFTIAGIKQAADWGIVRYGIVPMAEKYIQDNVKQQEIDRIESLKRQLENTKKELEKALGEQKPK
jgi:hypothetical protein